MPPIETSVERAVQLPRRKWSTSEFDALCRSGVLPEDERLELIDGELVPMTPPGEAHTHLTAVLNTALAKALPEGALMSSQSPIACGNSRPMPDLAVIPKGESRADRFASKVLLVVEVADSSLPYDRLKLATYARGSVPELWIVDVQGARIEVHTEPNKRAGTYQHISVLVPGDTLRTKALPRLKLPVTDLFGARH